jgi:hypothetical protein
MSSSTVTYLASDTTSTPLGTAANLPTMHSSVLCIGGNSCRSESGGDAERRVPKFEVMDDEKGA